MARERLELQVHRLRDVDDDRGVVPRHHVHLADLVGLELGEQLGEGHVIPRQRVHAVEHDPGGDPVVAVRGIEVGGAVRILGDDEVRPPAADLARDVAAEVAGVLELAVHVAEELHALHAEGPGGVPLLRLADPRQALGRHRAIAGALAAVGHDDVGDLLALPRELRDGAAGAELGVVGMGGHDQDTVDGCAHAA